MNIQKTYSAKNKDITPKWYLVDAKDQVLGRLSTEIATVLRGKNKPQFTPHVDCGDFVVVINAEKVKLTGNKWEEKNYYRHSGHIGRLKSKTARQVRDSHPDRLITDAVHGMLPKNKLSAKLLTKLKVFKGEEHTHASQNPTILKMKDK